MGRFAEPLGVPSLAGPYLLTMCALLVSGVIIAIFLRPDPLHVARDVRHGKERHSAMAPVERSMRYGARDDRWNRLVRATGWPRSCSATP